MSLFVSSVGIEKSPYSLGVNIFLPAHAQRALPSLNWVSHLLLYTNQVKNETPSSLCIHRLFISGRHANPRTVKKRAEPAFTSAEVCHASKSCLRGRFYAISYTFKKRAEPAFTSAKICHASKSCSRGRFYAISYTFKKQAEPAFTSAKVCHASKSCSRGRFYAISYTSKKAVCRFSADRAFYIAQIPLKLNVKLICLLASSRYSSCVFAPQLSSPAIPICCMFARITV